MTPIEKFVWLTDHGTLSTTRLVDSKWCACFYGITCVVFGRGDTYEKCIDAIYFRIKSTLWDKIHDANGYDLSDYL